MAIRDLTRAARLAARTRRPRIARPLAAPDASDLEASTFGSDSGPSSDFDPLYAFRQHNGQLPRSRYQYRSPKYYRGPLHPHQPPPASDPASREFIPGPFTAPRLQQTFQSTYQPDIMTLSYQHHPPGYVAPVKPSRLRSWDDSSPYHAGRPLRPPRGGDPLRMRRKPITFRNVPELESITVHSFVSEAGESSAPLHVAGMALQAITGVRATSHAARKTVSGWSVRAGRYMSLTCTLEREAAYHFLAKTIDVVLPRIKDWRGVRGSSGDSSGNITFGLDPEVVAYYPEIEVNYDSYPSKLIPGCHITVKTTARTDRDARLLLSSYGLPFYGKLVN